MKKTNTNDVEVDRQALPPIVFVAISVTVKLGRRGGSANNGIGRENRSVLFGTTPKPQPSISLEDRKRPVMLCKIWP